MPYASNENDENDFDLLASHGKNFNSGKIVSKTMRRSKKYLFIQFSISTASYTTNLVLKIK